MATEGDANSRDRARVVAIVGPTASGKTALSLQVAESLNGEVVACDSRTIYRYMDIGTAKPTKDERARVRHHMLDVAEPDETYTVAQYKAEASEAIRDIVSRGKLPVVCGGTGLYARALLEGLSMPEVPPDQELRKELNLFADQHGNQALHSRLMEIDRKTAERLSQNDRFRIVRALEVCMTTEKKFSDLAIRTEAPYTTIWIGLSVKDRAILKRRIKERFAEQMREGLLEEVETLLARYGPTRALKNAVTYRDLIRYLQSEITLDQAMDECLKHNYQLARRQIMWFRANESVNWFYLDDSEPSSILDEVIDLIVD